MKRFSGYSSRFRKSPFLGTKGHHGDKHSSALLETLFRGGVSGINTEKELFGEMEKKALHGGIFFRGQAAAFTARTKAPL